MSGQTKIVNGVRTLRGTTCQLFPVSISYNSNPNPDPKPNKLMVQNPTYCLTGEQNNFQYQFAL